MSITHDEYLDAISHLNRWFAADPERTPDDIRTYTPEGNARYRIQEYERLHEIELPPAAFRVNTEERLEWYVSKIADAESRKKRIQAQADAMIADEDRVIKGLEWRFGAQAEAMTRRLLEGKRGKSVKFLGGTIGLRKTPGRVGVEDLDTFIQEMPEDLRGEVLTVKADAAALNRLVKVVDGQAFRVDTGENITINGLKVTPEGEKLYVKAGKEE